MVSRMAISKSQQLPHYVFCKTMQCAIHKNGYCIIHVHVHIVYVHVCKSKQSKAIGGTHVCVLSTESLAYLTAATHGLAEEAQTIADTLQPSVEKVL